ncbi:mitogen-activated protein kinase kinase kinase 15-like [Maniola hyperantus]|uniref:mitogen-activated protein kinase kinase kinase 15-like n=1 Tax=Aphantopus hyperantus TaxID=2795564 RepID=UPI0021453904
MLEEQKMQTQILKEMVDKKSSTRSQTPSSESTGEYDREELEAFREWLLPRGISDEAAIALVSQHYTLPDVLQHVQREDIARLNLKGGIELRLWRAIVEHRMQNNSNHLRRTSSTETDMDTNSIVVVECQKCKTSRTISNNSSCSNNPTVVIRDQQVNGDDTVGEYYTENGIVNL